MITPEQAEQMRAILAAHDANKPGGIKEFDLNNPPKLPYRYQEFPRIMYHEDGRTRAAQNAEEMNAALEMGWAKEPFPPEVDEPASPWAPVSDEEAPKKKRGRPAAVKAE